jgi:hypothetical protein
VAQKDAYVRCLSLLSAKRQRFFSKRKGQVSGTERERASEMLIDVAILDDVRLRKDDARRQKLCPPTRKIHDVIYVCHNAIHAALTAAPLVCPGG